MKPTEYTQMNWDINRHFYVPTKDGIEKGLCITVDYKIIAFYCLE